MKFQPMNTAHKVDVLKEIDSYSEQSQQGKNIMQLASLNACIDLIVELRKADDTMSIEEICSAIEYMAKRRYNNDN